MSLQFPGVKHPERAIQNQGKAMLFEQSFRLLILPGLLLGVPFLSGVQTASATTAAVITSGDWICELPDSITRAGEYYPDEIQSSPDTLPGTLTCSETYLSIVNIPLPTTQWTVTSQLETGLSGLTLDLRRTGNGSGLLGTGLLGASSGGEDYIRQSTVEQTFFSGEGLISQVPLQFRIGGFDVDDGYGIKNISIKYRITIN